MVFVELTLINEQGQPEGTIFLQTSHAMAVEGAATAATVRIVTTTGSTYRVAQPAGEESIVQRLMRTQAVGA